MKAAKILHRGGKRWLGSRGRQNRGAGEFDSQLLPNRTMIGRGTSVPANGGISRMLAMCLEAAYALGLSNMSLDDRRR